MFFLGILPAQNIPIISDLAQGGQKQENLERLNEQLEKEQEELKQKIEEQENTINQLQEQLKSKDEEIQELTQQINSLENAAQTNPQKNQQQAVDIAKVYGEMSSKKAAAIITELSDDEAISILSSLKKPCLLEF